MPETLTLTEPFPGVTVATLNRPERYNAMTDTMFAELEQVARDSQDQRVLIITGAGRAFCAGYDIEAAQELSRMSGIEFLDLQERAARALLAIRSLRIPVIAAVNGVAAGGGMSLALAADIRVGSAAARFNAAFVKIGLSAGDLGVSWLLPRLVGPGIANEIAFTGRIVESEEAARIGLLNSIHEDALAGALTIAEQIVANSPAGVRMSKRALQMNAEIPSYAAAMELENRGQALLTRTDDMPEALAAFTEKRPPKFVGH